MKIYVMKSNPVIIEKDINASIEVIWDAITNLDKMNQWFFDNIPEFKPESGFQTRFIVKSGERNFTHVWKILEVIPGKLIKYDWRYEEYEGEGTVTFALFEKEGKSFLKLTNEGLETFPDSIPEFKRESCEAGWIFFMDRLRSYLEQESGSS